MDAFFHSIKQYVKKSLQGSSLLVRLHLCGAFRPTYSKRLGRNMFFFQGLFHFHGWELRWVVVRGGKGIFQKHLMKNEGHDNLSKI